MPQRDQHMDDIREMLDDGAPFRTWIWILIVLSIIGCAIVWSHWATLDEVTTGVGRVVPSKHLQVVQTLEGGIVREIHTREGDFVETGQILMRIDDTGFASRLGELRQRKWSLQAEIARLLAETRGQERASFDAGLERDAPNVVISEKEAFQARRLRLAGELAILRQQLIQKQHELEEFGASEIKLVATLDPLLRELDLTQKLNDQGVVSEVELLRLQRQVADNRGQLNVVLASVPRAKAAITEAENRIENAKAVFQVEARQRLARANLEFAIIAETIRAAKDRVARTILKSPVRGIINKLNVNTIGAVVKPGQDIIQIVPIGDALLIEARIRPQDVAFIRPEQIASVKLTAYDYLVYGALSGQVTRISADTISDEKGDTYYRVMVRTDRNHLSSGDKKLRIIPGMVATVDILTSKKTVLDYLLKPINRVRYEALRER